MPKINVTLAEREQIAEATWAFRLGLGGQSFPYRAGQTIDLTLPDPPHADAAGNQRTFSLAGAPGGAGLMFATRVRGSAFKRSLLEMPLGATLELEGPFGSFTLPNRPTPIVMFAGGIGVTPFRAMVEDARARSLEHPLTLVHSNRTPEEAPFLAELTGWGGESPRFVYRPVMTRAERSRGGWPGERGRVDAEFLARLLVAGAGGTLYYAAGPERFVKAVTAALTSVGGDADDVRFEEFPGY